MNKKQLAVFQNIPLPENPLLTTDNKINRNYNFLYDSDAQKKKKEEFFNLYSNNEILGNQESKVNYRLKKFYKS
jgi:hypothetical protein